MDPWQPCAVTSSSGVGSSHVTNVDDLASSLLHNRERDHEADQVQDISVSSTSTSTQQENCHQEEEQNQSQTHNLNQPTEESGADCELSFGDNFKPFVKLPDSQDYLESLERKLKVVQKGGKKGPTAESILRSLEQTKESCMIKLLSNSVEQLTIEGEIFEELKVNPLLKKLAPERQALTAEELVHLLKADQLDIVLSNSNFEELLSPSSTSSAEPEAESEEPSTSPKPEVEKEEEKPEEITGASRGIGRTIAIEFSKKVANQSVFLLMARSTSALEETKAAISSATEGRVSVVTATIDLEKPDKDAYHNAISSALTQTNTTAADFEHSILVHNAGSLGVEKKFKVVEMEDLADLSSYFSLNVISMVILSSQFFKVFNDSSKQRSIVQITSLSGLQPFKTWGLYCTGKAARDMLMKVVALESGIQVLNWAPGPVETEMFDNVCKHTGDPDLLKAFTECRDEGKVLTCEQTVTKLVKVLGEKKYVNGEHVDYFDIE
ncbi:unnamed protein product [Orchesella dallaii]|uniref:Sepiapterin reductase n=1 Tax=Orchesella dallaii TaxID=48710 RepID=A0ABP1QMY7_9HEXA